MSCSKFETDIGLYAGGDLPAGRIARIEAHLAECEDCRALAKDLRVDRGRLGELSDDPAVEAMLAQVHDRVLAEVRHTPWKAGLSRRGSLVPLLALAAAVILAVILLWPRHAVKHAPVARVATHIAPVPPVGIVPARHRVVRRHRRAPAAQTGPPLLVQFVTDDPNIVIYWLVNQKPQGD
jgi:anti-sigma factor RsiW